jgi:hypothetical protein
VEPGPLQADAVTLDELRRMVRTADRTTACGRQVAVTLILDWWMAARASEPARLNLHEGLAPEEWTPVRVVMRQVSA